MAPWWRLLGLVILGGVLLAGCKPQPLDLVVLHTNDVLGFTEQAT